MSIDIAKQFRERGPLRDSSLFDPDSVDKVETREKNDSTIIETIQSGDISNPSTGEYEVSLDESKYDTATQYVADWTYTDGGLQSTQTRLFELLDLGGTIVVSPDQVDVTVAG